MLNQTFEELKVSQHPDWTFIGRIFLPDYPLGHMIAFQLQEQLERHKRKASASAMKSIGSRSPGPLLPNPFLPRLRKHSPHCPNAEPEAARNSQLVKLYFVL
jgi:hypothetical protein